MADLSTSIAKGDFKDIIVVTGAGVSTNAGIPDYRSKDGLVAQLTGGGSNCPEDIFTRGFASEYESHPLYQERIQHIRNANPTPSHILCKWLSERGWLRRVYTQNIDGLHQKAGLPDDMVVEYHGSVFKDNIVLYGDPVSKSVIGQTFCDFVENKRSIDLILVMGTSLQVAPFCAIPNLVPKSCTRVLVDINPSNAFVNAWSKQTKEPESIYANTRCKTSVKFAKGCASAEKRVVSLRPAWQQRGKWKSQYIVTSDVDKWAGEVMRQETIDCCSNKISL